MALTVTNRAYKDHLGRTINGKMPIGNMGDKGVYSIDVECEFAVYLSFNLTVSVNTGSSTIILNGGTWNEYGFNSGDSFTVEIWNFEHDKSFTGTLTINIINGSEMTINGITFTETFVATTGYLYVNKAPQSILTEFNLTPHDSNNLQSLVDATTPRYINNAINGLAVSGSAFLNPLLDYSGHGIEQVKITRNSDTKSGRARNYTIEVTFYWWLYLSEFTDEFFDTATVTPIIKPTFYPLWNDVSSFLTTTFKAVGDGNSGFRNENFNQNVNNFKILSSVFKNSVNNNVIGGIDYLRKTKFEITVENVNSLGFGNKLGLVMFNDLQDKLNYQTNATLKNFKHTEITALLEHNELTMGGAGVTINSKTNNNGGSYTITNAKVEMVGANAKFSGEIEFNAQFKAQLSTEEENNFVLLVRCESSSFSANNYSDTVNLLAWIGEAKSYPVIMGKYWHRTLKLQPHGGGYDKSDIFQPITEDDFNVVSVGKKQVLDEELLSVTVNIGIYNTVTNEMIPLHSYTIPIEQTYIGGYLTGTSSIDMIWKPYFSDLAITTVGKIEADHVTHEIAITAPVLLNWRYWVDRFNLANIFGANATDNYRGYIGGDWIFGIQILTLTPVGMYEDSFSMPIRDYDDNLDLTPTSFVMKKESDNTVVTAFLENEKIVCEALFTLDSSTIEVINYAVVTIEGFENNTRWTLSSAYNSVGQSNSPLQPINGELKLKLTNDVNSPTVAKLQFVVDTNKLPNSDNFKLTFRLYN
jgi:hypothetical protein